MTFSHPIMTCREAQAYEKELLGGDAVRVWKAMNEAGRSLGRGILEDFKEIGPFPEKPRLLLLCGKGHNAGDAILAADEICLARPESEITLIFIYGDSGLKPLVRRSLEVLLKRMGERLVISTWREARGAQDPETGFDICIDGILGMQFKPPLRSPGDAVVAWINRFEKVRFRAAVDLPSGVGDESVAEPFRADFTYSTGIVKAPLLASRNLESVGRIRYLDIGFFAKGKANKTGSRAFLLASVLDPLRRLRRSRTDKRSYGHLYVLGGSRSMPGAAQMAVRAAVKSGVGLVTAFIPESMVSAFSAVIPEAMWVPVPESSGGGLRADGFQLLKERIGRATALLAGPGMGREEGTLALLEQCVEEIPLPMVLDADALQGEIMEKVKNRPKEAGGVILTPHAGEFKRIAGEEENSGSDQEILKFSAAHRLVAVLKGPVTRICDGRKVLYSCFGGPLLARGGSGDILGGLTGGMLARPGADPLVAACRGVALHGLAADLLARARGQEAVRTTEVLEFLPEALRHG